MNISYNWLKRYLKTDLSAEEMATILTDIGLEVESFEKIESIRGGLAGVVVGEVLTCTDHPDSDHLHLTTVDVGGEAPLQIVCGAPNCRQGLKVLCATVGAVLYPNGGEEEFKIKRSKIRGVESLGMLCAEDELGIGASHEGIMELPADAKVGQPAWEYLKLEDDYVIGIGLTPNRIDAASHIGVARDLAAYLKSQGKPVELQWPDVSAFAVDNHDLKIDVQVENSEAAPRYAGVTVKNCKIGPSPEWMQNCLRTAGITPKNNLVDITNFVLFELGQPLHAFDAAKIDGGRIVVRTCEEGTPFVTLDGVERKLTANDLMICSAAKPMCIAGVYGGLDSGVSDTTTDVFIESAYFNPVWVRKTAKRFGLNTDSSFRFERGVDPDIQVYALKRAALLMKELAGGEIASEITDICSAPIEKFKVELDIKRVNRLIGKEIPADTIRTILGALDIKIEAEEGDLWRVAVPPYRVDVTREADLVEEILRIYGYNNIPVPSHVNSALSYAPKPDRNTGTDKQKADELMAEILKMREDTQSAQQRSERHATDAAFQYARSRAVECQPPQWRPEAVRVRQLLFLRCDGRYAGRAAEGLFRAVPPGDRRNRHRCASFVEPETGAGIVLYAASDCREAVASFRARPLYAQVRIAPQRSLRGCTLLLAQRQGQRIGTDGRRFVEAAQDFRPETRCLLSGDGFRGPGQGYTQE